MASKSKYETIKTQTPDQKWGGAVKVNNIRKYPKDNG
jgi:hypothetical protein